MSYKVDLNILDEFISANGAKMEIVIQQLRENIKALNAQIFKAFIFLVVIVFLYFLFEDKRIDRINFGPAEISDISSIRLFIPPLFAMVYMYIVVCHIKCSKLYGVLIRIYHKFFNVDPQTDEATIEKVDRILDDLSPYRFMPAFLQGIGLGHEERGARGCIVAFISYGIVAIPMGIVFFSPYIFSIYFNLKIIDYWSLTWGKLAFAITMAANISTALFWLKTKLGFWKRATKSSLEK